MDKTINDLLHALQARAWQNTVESQKLLSEIRELQRLVTVENIQLTKENK